MYDSLLITTGSKNKKLDFGLDNEDVNQSILYLRDIEETKKIKKSYRYSQ